MNYLDIEKGGFPTTYVVLADSVEEAVERVYRSLIAEPTDASAKRMLEAEEIDDLRTEYTSLYEVDRVECEKELEQLKNEKRMLEERIKSKCDQLASIMQHINDNVKTINDGYVVETLDKACCFKAVVDGHVLHYKYMGEGHRPSTQVFTLARVDTLDKNDHSIFAMQTANNEAFIELFGADFNELGNYTTIDAILDNKERLIGSKLAVAVHTEFADIQRDTILTEEMAEWIIKDEDVDSIVIYATTDEAARP